MTSRCPDVRTLHFCVDRCATAPRATRAPRRRLETSPVGRQVSLEAAVRLRVHILRKMGAPTTPRNHIRSSSSAGPTPKSARSAPGPPSTTPPRSRCTNSPPSAARLVVAHLQPPERLERGAGPAPQPASGTTARFTFGRRPAHDGPRDQDFTKTVPALPFRAAVDAPTPSSHPWRTRRGSWARSRSSAPRARAPDQRRLKSPRGRRARSAVVP